MTSHDGYAGSWLSEFCGFCSSVFPLFFSKSPHSVLFFFRDLVLFRPVFKSLMSVWRYDVDDDDDDDDDDVDADEWFLSLSRPPFERMCGCREQGTGKTIDEKKKE